MVLKRTFCVGILVVLMVLCSACATGQSRYGHAAASPSASRSDAGGWSAGRVQEGIASWYGEQFHGKKTANGDLFDMYALSAAHKTMPLGSQIRVTNLGNGRSVTLVVNDRGPFVENRILDCSMAAARELGYDKQGTARVRIEMLQVGDNRYAGGGIIDDNGAVGGDNIVIGEYSSRWKAERIYYYLRGRYKTCRIEGDNESYRVMIGPFTSTAVKSKILARLRREGYDAR